MPKERSMSPLLYPFKQKVTSIMFFFQIYSMHAINYLNLFLFLFVIYIIKKLMSPQKINLNFFLGDVPSQIPRVLS
jgi:hypothetical protein